MNRIYFVLSLFLLAFLACVMPLQAAYVYWNHVNGDFCDGLNWSTGTFPAETDDVCIQSSRIDPDPNFWYETDLGATPVPNAINNLYVGNGVTSDGTPAGAGWLVQTDQTLNVNNQVFIGRNSDPSQPTSYTQRYSEYDISGGTLNVSTSTSSAIRVTYQDLLVCVFDISGTAVVNVNPSDGTGILYVGQVFNSTGIVRQSDSSTVTLRSGISLGPFDPLTTGYYGMSGGSLIMNTYGQAAKIGDNGKGLFEQSGGSVYVAGATIFGDIDHTTKLGGGVLNISGGTYSTGSVALGKGRTTTGILNLSGTGVFECRNADIPLGNNNYNTSGIVNLGTGGTLKTTGMYKGGAAVVGQLNFHGGTLTATASRTDFLDRNFNAAVDAYVYSEGGTIDTNGNDIVITQPLAAPTGNGLSSVTVLPVTTDWRNWEYRCPPVVTISPAPGDTTGQGATGYAVLDGYQIASIVITNPGVNYTLPPIISLQGGKFQEWDQIGPTQTPPNLLTAIAPNSDTGGITKMGDGILALAAVNTFTGTTTIEGGTLALHRGRPA